MVESPFHNLLCLEGYNTYAIEENLIEDRLDFEPATQMFFVFPEDEFGNLSKAQIQERVLNEMYAFTRSEKFNQSFLAKGGSLRFGLNVEICSG